MNKKLELEERDLKDIIKSKMNNENELLYGYVFKNNYSKANLINAIQLWYGLSFKEAIKKYNEFTKFVFFL